MTAITTAAIAGSGIAALATAIRLADAGVEVDVFEQRESTNTLGSGITLQGNALRALDQVGVWDEVKNNGYVFDGLNLRAPGPEAAVVASLPEVATGGENYPAAMGMYRPVLAKIMLDRAERSGVRVHYSSQVSGFTQYEAGSVRGVEVEVNGSPVGRFDLLVGADGLHSRVRELMGISTAPARTGMGIWRTVVSRPAEVTSSELYYGGPVYIAGYTPTSEKEMYAFLVEPAQDRSGLDAAASAEIMHDLSAGYSGPWESVRQDLARGQGANYTWFTQHVVEEPWNRGRVVIIGDAAHSCPPTVAQGAAQALEDAVVLTELLSRAEAVDDNLWREFHERRLPRATRVVEASVQLGQWQIDKTEDADPAGLIFGLARFMAEPA